MKITFFLNLLRQKQVNLESSFRSQKCYTMSLCYVLFASKINTINAAFNKCGDASSMWYKSRSNASSKEETSSTRYLSNWAVPPLNVFHTNSVSSVHFTSWHLLCPFLWKTVKLPGKTAIIKKPKIRFSISESSLRFCHINAP